MKNLYFFYFWFLLSIILLQHLSLAEDDHEALEKYDDAEEEFGIEANSEEEKEFKTKAHFDPGTFYYVLSKNPQKNVQYAAQVAPILSQHQRKTRPVWGPSMLPMQQFIVIQPKKY